MTCIAAFVQDGSVWMGADSAGVGGYDLTVRADQKIFRNGDMLFGFTSSFRMGQLLRHALTVPDHDPRIDVEKYLSTTFIDAVRACLKERGWASKSNERESGGTFLIGYRGRLFQVEDDYQVGIAIDGFDACGCGGQIAKGALYASTHLKAAERIETALKAAERFSAGVRGPFHIQCLEAKS